jgi:DNA ligase D-like protein (predicted 3'-phosphoesterase)
MGSDDKLKAYRDKRDFRRTPEPAGGEGHTSDKPVFVIQKHDASRLHYDLRLEVDGVLKSWAVPKGPSTDPSQRRLAVPTEDHPLEYADFEGVIPEGEYGGGTMIVWDKGTYRNLQAEKDESRTMAEAYEDGHIEVWLEGEKLSGGYALVRTGKGDDSRWLLIKMKDDRADARRNPTSTEPQSVLSGRTLEEVREQEADGGSEAD